MTMRSSKLKYIFKEGFKSVWRNRMMSLASISSVGATLVILGLVLITILNINNMSNVMKEEFDEIEVFLLDELNRDEINDIEDEIKDYNGINSVVFVSKEEAFESFKEDLGEDGSLLNDSKDALPNSFIITVKDVKYAEKIVSRLEGIQGVEEVKYFKDIIAKMIPFTEFVRMAGLTIIGILTLLSIFIISNTIKITVAARKNDINIMKYVGGTNGYIRGPFMIEGMILGLIGSLVAALIINFGYAYIHNNISEKLIAQFSVYTIKPELLISEILIVFAAVGTGIGILGSIFSLRKYLKV